ncbi:30S ribosomal protein S4 [Candidatus Berkelbacteria bacterium]|nr:30S ribosomal protein S4 [Candidatus Berkelbacteria bacterium]
MARYIGPTERISRRARVNLFLKGERSSGPKNALTRRPYPPGVHGPNRRPNKISEYGRQLREKQNAKAIYGILERQFRNYYKKASLSDDNTGEKLVQLLELRLDNIVYRLGLADTRRQARQYVTHGHVLVDGIRQSIPSMNIKPKQKIELHKINRKPSQNEVPIWLKRPKTGLKGEVLDLPERDQIALDIEEQLIVEFYSR